MQVTVSGLLNQFHRIMQGVLFPVLSPDTVHLIILMALGILILGSGLRCRGRSGKLLILRLTLRGLRRLRLDTYVCSW